MAVHIFLGIWATVVPQNSSVGSRPRGGAQLLAAVAAIALAHEKIINAYNVLARLVFIYALAHDLVEFFGKECVQNGNLKIFIASKQPKFNAQ